MAIENFSFELPGTDKQKGFDNVPGWNTDEPCAATMLQITVYYDDNGIRVPHPVSLPSVAYQGVENMELPALTVSQKPIQQWP